CRPARGRLPPVRPLLRGTKPPSPVRRAVRGLPEHGPPLDTASTAPRLNSPAARHDEAALIRHRAPLTDGPVPHPVPQPELGEGAGDVPVDGGLAEVEPGADLGVRQALSH